MTDPCQLAELRRTAYWFRQANNPSSRCDEGENEIILSFMSKAFWQRVQASVPTGKILQSANAFMKRSEQPDTILIRFLGLEVQLSRP